LKVLEELSELLSLEVLSLTVLEELSLESELESLEVLKLTVLEELSLEALEVLDSKVEQDKYLNLVSVLELLD
jgi:hypothetical protein